jgi:DHA2 family multidrug resistance protein
MVTGFACLQLMLDRGERLEWFDSWMIVTLGLVAVTALIGFVLRKLTAEEPILDLSVFVDRNFAVGTGFMAVVGVGFYSSMVLLALYTQKLLGYDAWTSGLVLAPAGVGNLVALLIAGRLVARVDQRPLLAMGFLLNGIALHLMANLTLGMDYWTLVWPRFIQGFGQGFIFVPLSTLALATVRKDGLGNATAAFNVIRNVGGSCGVALAATFLARRSQYHQTTLVSHVNIWSPDTAARLKDWSDHFLARGADPFTAQSRALAMVYRDTVGQAQVLAYADEFCLLSIMFFAITLLVPLMRRIRSEPLAARGEAAAGPVDGLRPTRAAP